MSEKEIPPSPKAQPGKNKPSGKNRWPPKDIEDVVTAWPIKTISLFDAYLDIAVEWHYKKNCGFGPEDFNYGSGVKAWWRCSRDKRHIWRAPIHNRTGLGSGCPFCYDEGWGIDLDDYPKALKLFDEKKNKKVNIHKLPVGKAVFWRCKKAPDHVWKGCFNLEQADNMCPFCLKLRASSTYSIENNKLLRKEFHSTKNKGFKPIDLTPGSRVKVFWQCSSNKEHVWQATVFDRSTGDGCPYCSRRLLAKEFTLAALHPHLAKEFHPTKNGELKASSISAAYKPAIWWQCQKDKGHEWQGVIKTRVKSHAGCPFCDYLQVSKTNNLAFNNPDIAEEFDLDLNFPLTPNDVTYCSARRVSWRCPVGHKYKARIIDRAVHGKTCHICKPMLRTKPLSKFKQLVAELHPTKNKGLDPSRLPSASEKKVWWKCSRAYDHEWQATPANRVRNNQGCPYCKNQKVAQSNCLATLRPDIAKELHPIRNKGVTAKDIVPGSNMIVWWQCALNPKHAWQSRVCARTRGKGAGCPKCGTGIGGKVKAGTVLSVAHPDVAKDWHPTKNGRLKPDDVTAKSELRAWWRCHRNPLLVFEQEIGERVRRGCQFCRIKDKNLRVLYPDIAKRLHPTKNPGSYAEAVTPGSYKTAWWICAENKEHIFEAKVYTVTKSGSGCPYCSGKKVNSTNSLATLCPVVASQWNFKRNRTLSPDEVTRGSSIKVWWICKNGHEWQATVASRAIDGNGCKVCSYESRRKETRKVSDDED